MITKIPLTLACEPILPFMYAAGGPGFLMRSVVALVIAVCLKSLLFARLQQGLSFGRATCFMLIGNVLTTIVGAVAAAMMGANMVGWIIGLPIIWVTSIPGARRFAKAAGPSSSWQGSAGVISIAATIGFAASCYLFMFARISQENLVAYWVFKISAVYVALLVSIGLTTYWEEWVIWRLSRSEANERKFIRPAVYANLAVFFGAALYGAILMLPARLLSPDFMVAWIRAAVDAAQAAIAGVA